MWADIRTRWVALTIAALLLVVLACSSVASQGNVDNGVTLSRDEDLLRLLSSRGAELHLMVHRASGAMEAGDSVPFGQLERDFHPSVHSAPLDAGSVHAELCCGYLRGSGRAGGFYLESSARRGSYLVEKEAGGLDKVREVLRRNLNQGSKSVVAAIEVADLLREREFVPNLLRLCRADRPVVRECATDVLYHMLSDCSDPSEMKQLMAVVEKEPGGKELLAPAAYKYLRERHKTEDALLNAMTPEPSQQEDE